MDRNLTVNKVRFEHLVKSIVIATIVWVIIPSTSCTNEPLIIDPVDTLGGPCDSEIVYFEMQVLPILRGNCSIVGCHDVVTARNGVVLDSYDNLIATTVVTPFDLEETEIYERLTEDDPQKRMPRFPRDPLDPGLLSIISEWILQGAENLTCEADTVCSVAPVSYAMDIAPLMRVSCFGCHSGPNPIGGFSLAEYDEVAEKALAGRLYGAVAALPGFVPMPLSQKMIPDCDIDLIKVWADNGAPNN